MLIVACVFAGFAALVHVYIFVLESLRWEDPSTRRTFGTTEDTAAITRSLAYNQGFYNLFLAVGTAVGIALVPSGQDPALALLLLSLGSMVAAATVLITSDRSKARAALVQALFPGLALLSLLVWSLT
jgi:putative membrane protein